MAWSKAEIIEGLVIGGERVHGYTPDGSLLCGTLGDDASEPYDRAGPHQDAIPFTEDTDNACKRCLASWRKLAE